ncbi:hypothetical protein FZ934_02675 [Rhizobium grahamii]|uniref:Uncharacterized protein n=1 Tax=Rhizobium grahamii TaxID=1120045 RepID=A0A5Q0C2G0_9HYPH|nr:hypothetical protein [Rhizobium grahamii]QFY59435.1 hypothetical protein FZ934_02675 [Rhizobium grahamii]
MVMSFFRRGEDGRPQPTAGYRPTSITEQRTTGGEPLRYSVADVNEFSAFGSALEESQRTSEDLMSSIASLQQRVSSLLGTHSQSLTETGALRAECARISSLLEYESNARQKADQDNARLSGENKDFRNDNSQLRSETEALRDELTKLQGVHGVTCEEFTIVETRLLDAERELSDRAIQFDEASALLKRTQLELDQRSRELANTREKLDGETTAHQLLIETSRRENGVQAREMARLNEERSQLKSGLMEQEALVRNLQMTTASLKQDLALFEERHKRLEMEFETLQASSALEIAHLTTKHEAIGSKAELVEKLLVTANGRNRITDEELQAARAELKRVRSELSTSLSRTERLNEELQRARTSGAESEAARRELASQSNELTLKLRETDSLRLQRDRDADALRRDMDTRMDSDRHEIGQLRTSLEIAKSEIRQLRAERAILTGQLEVARSERPGPLSSSERTEEPRMPAATFTPMIDISEKSLRLSGDLVDPRLTPAE